MTSRSITEQVQQWVRPEIRALKAYHVPDPAGVVKLDAMENPYSWPSELTDAWTARLSRAELNRYPDPAAQDLVDRLRSAFAIPAGSGVLLGNGSDELIQLIMMSVAVPGRSILAAEPGFSMYSMISTFVGLDYHGVPLRSDDFSLDGEAMLAAIERHQPAVVFLAYPNNPTGNLFDRGTVNRIIEAAPGLVVIDEAYHAFAGGETWMSQLSDHGAAHEKLLLLRTVSKMGLAGLRLGILCGAPQWLDEINKIRLPYNINVLTQLSAAFALEHQSVFDTQTQQISRDREAMYDALAAMPLAEVFPSKANFILFRVPEGRATDVMESLRARKVLIKNLHGAHPMLHDCLRVTVGTAEENRAFLDALEEIQATVLQAG